MPSKKQVRTDAATFAKMLADQGFAYKHLYETYERDFSFNYNKFNLAAKGHLEEDLFQEFCTEKSANNILKSYNPAKGLFSTWINTAMFNYCCDIAKKHTIEEESDHYNAPNYKFNFEDVIEDGENYDYAYKLLVSVLGTIKNITFRIILEDLLINGEDKNDTITKLGIDIATYNTYKMRAITQCSEILYEIGHIDNDQKEYIQHTRRRGQPADTGFLGFTSYGFMSNFEVIPMSGDRDIDWIMMKLRDLQA